MRKNLFCVMTVVMTGIMTLSSCAVSDNPSGYEPTKPVVTESIGEQLQKVERISDIRELGNQEKYGYKEAYDFMFEQPVDHQNPAAGKMYQRVVVCVRDVNAPTVLYTNGYLIRAKDKAYDYDISYSLGANLVAIEHRYFGDSKNDADTEWKYLTTRQSADDMYEVVKVLKKMLPKEWVSTGTSKDGMTSMFLRYYHPDAVDVTTVFCAPFMTSLQDRRVGRYLQTESGKGTDKEATDKRINRMLANGRNGIYKTANQMMKEYNEYQDKTYNGLKFENYVKTVVLGTFRHFSYSDAETRAKNLPAENCSDFELASFFYKAVADSLKKWKQTPANYWERWKKTYPYSIQTAKELGQYAADYTLVEEQLKGVEVDYNFLNNPTPFNPSTLFNRDIWLYDTYSNAMMLDLLNNFLPTTKAPILFVYSKDDPWTGARPAKINESVAKMIINPNGIHNQDINNQKHYSQQVRQEILDYIGKYITITKTAAARRSAANVPSVEPEHNDDFMIEQDF